MAAISWRWRKLNVDSSSCACSICSYKSCSCFMSACARDWNQTICSQFSCLWIQVPNSGWITKFYLWQWINDSYVDSRILYKHHGKMNIMYNWYSQKQFILKLMLWTRFDIHRAVHCNTISIVESTRCTNVSNLFYFGMTLYMFWTVFPSIIRSSRLYIHQQAFVKQILLYVQSWTPDDGRKDHPKHVTCGVPFQNKINLIHWCI